MLQNCVLNFKRTFNRDVGQSLLNLLYLTILFLCNSPIKDHIMSKLGNQSTENSYSRRLSRLLLRQNGLHNKGNVLNFKRTFFLFCGKLSTIKVMSAVDFILDKYVKGENFFKFKRQTMYLKIGKNILNYRCLHLKRY